ncbi:MAG: hypothetical protein Kow0069_15840 [Promethearchaeota archaeon]
MRFEFPATRVGRGPDGKLFVELLNQDGSLVDQIPVEEIFEEYVGKRITFAVDDEPSEPAKPLFEGDLAERARRVAEELDLRPAYQRPRDDLNAYNWLRAQYDDRSRFLKDSFEAASPRSEREVFAWRDRLKERLEELLGLPGTPAPLSVEWGPEAEFDGLTLKKVYFQSQPGLKVPAVLAHPEGLDEPRPAVLCLHGHNQGKVCTLGFHHSSSNSYWGYELAKRGFVTLSPDQLGWGERFAVAKRRYADSEKAYSRTALLLGTTSIGLRVWDAQRGLDFLQSLDVVDGERLGVIGHSGGGMICNFLAPLDDRVKAAVVSGYFCRWLDSIFTLSHCVCNYVPGILKVAECADVLAATVPRPVFVVAGERDPIFPLAGVKAAYATLKRVYEVAGAPDLVDLDVLEGVGHSFSGRKAYPWLKEALSAAP